jgi:YD repeat-containing protein
VARDPASRIESEGRCLRGCGPPRAFSDNLCVPIGAICVPIGAIVCPHWRHSDPAGNVTTNQYNAAGYLVGVDGPLPGASDIIHHTYDAFGRVRTTTQPGGYTVTRDYDALDRPTLVTYPDGTTEQFAYARGGVKLLDRTHQKDRDNRWTRSFYNALRERVVVVDPMQRRTVFNAPRQCSLPLHTYVKRKFLSLELPPPD